MSTWKKFFLALKEYLQALFIFVLAYAVSWAAIIGIVWSILKLFGLSISIVTATYVWLVLLLIDGVILIVIDKIGDNQKGKNEDYEV